MRHRAGRRLRPVHGFHTEALGLHLLTRFGSEWACLDAGGGMLIGLVPRQRDATEHVSVGLYASEFDAAVEALRADDVTVELASESGGSVRLAYFQDPDGHQLYFTDFPPNPTGRFTHQASDDDFRPFFEHLGLRWNTGDGGRVSVELDLRDDLRGPAGTLQGGIIATLVDVAAASTAALTGASFVATTQMTLHYLAPGRVGPVRAVGELLRSGARTFTVEARVYDAGLDDRLMAVALAAFSSLAPESSAVG